MVKLSEMQGRALGAQAANGWAQHDHPFPFYNFAEVLDPKTVTAIREEYDNVPLGAWQRFANENERKLGCSDPAFFGVETRQVIDYLQSDPFVEFLRGAWDKPGLQIDPNNTGAGMHRIIKGGVLNMHVDFNAHPQMHWRRAINLLLYLTPEWNMDWGGQLILADSDGNSVILEPNARLVMFECAEDHWHGHPFPITPMARETRDSIAVYYYDSEDVVPDDELHSTLWLS